MANTSWSGSQSNSDSNSGTAQWGTDLGNNSVQQAEKAQQGVSVFSNLMSRYGQQMTNAADNYANTTLNYSDYAAPTKQAIGGTTLQNTNTSPLVAGDVTQGAQYNQPAALADQLFTTQFSPTQFTDMGVGTNETSDQALFDLMARRYRESTLPTYSARGVNTSGPGLNAESQGIQELSTLFAGTAFDRAAKAQELKTALESASATSQAAADQATVTAEANKAASNTAVYSANASSINDWYNSLVSAGAAQDAADLAAYQSNTANDAAVNAAITAQYDAETQREASQASSDAAAQAILDARENSKADLVKSQTDATIAALQGAAALEDLAVDDQTALLTAIANLINAGKTSESTSSSYGFGSGASVDTSSVGAAAAA